MSQLALDLMPYVSNMVSAMIGTAIILGFVRLARGPTLLDRVVALDLIAMLAAGAIAVYAIRTERAIVVLVAIVLALLLFVATVALAMSVEKHSTEK